MKYEIIYQDLMSKLRHRIPQNSKLVVKLVEILSYEKEAVYRRLRQEVPFTFEEIVIIAKEFNISLDSMLGVDAVTTLPFRIQSDRSENLVEIDYLLLKEYLQAIKDAASDSKGEISFITNMLPQSFYTGFNSIYRFYYFKWQFYSIPTDLTKSYHEIILPDQLIQIIREIFVNLKNIKLCYYVLDNRIFQNFVEDVIYFNSIRLIKDEDVLLIKNELLQFIDHMEAVATNGFADIPENKVYIYISDTSIDTSHSYVDSLTSFRFALTWSFIFNSVLSIEDEALKIMKHRIRSKIRTSTLLSVSGEKQRTQYFETQRKIVEQMRLSQNPVMAGLTHHLPETEY